MKNCFREKKLVIVFFSCVILFTSTMCIQLNWDSNENEIDKTSSFLEPYISSLENAPPKQGLLSEKEAAILAYKYACKLGYTNDIQTLFPDSYNKLDLGDMFLVEDSNNGDYFFISLEHEDGTLAVIAQIDAVDGRILSCGAYDPKKPQQKVKLNRSKEISNYLGSSYNRGISYVKPVFINSPENYNQLCQWQWLICFDRSFSTKSGDRNLLLIDPFQRISSLSNDNFSKNKTISSNKYKTYYFKEKSEESLILLDSKSNHTFTVEGLYE